MTLDNAGIYINFPFNKNGPLHRSLFISHAKRILLNQLSLVIFKCVWIHVNANLVFIYENDNRVLLLFFYRIHIYLFSISVIFFTTFVSFNLLLKFFSPECSSFFFSSTFLFPVEQQSLWKKMWFLYSQKLSKINFAVI